jgi:hypothetical protein
MSCDNSRFNFQHIVLYGKYSTTILEELTSWAVNSVIFSFLAAHFPATLRGLLGGAGRQASRLAGLSMMRGIGQSRVAEPGTQLKSLLERLLILAV